MSRVLRACELDEGLTLVRYPHTGDSYANPSNTRGVPVVSSPLRQNDVDNEVRHRISTLYSAASEVHPAQRSTDASAGLVTLTEEGGLSYYSLRRDRLQDATSELVRFLT